MRMIAPQDFFSLLSDETRLRCLLLLQKEKELCVCELSEVICSIQPKISRHLALLRKSGVVTDERRGQWVYYRLSEKLPHWVNQVLGPILNDLKEVQPYKSDFERIERIRCKNFCA